MLLLLLLLSAVEAFSVVPSRQSSRFIFQATLDDEDEQIGDDLDTGSIDLEDLHWRVAKMRLEEENTRRFLKARPRFLPYEECRKWVQAWSRWQNEEDWRDWIAMGEKRNSYIPSEPDVYYGRLGQWISWEHFLGIDNDDVDSY